MRNLLLATATLCTMATAASATVTYTLTNPVYNQAAIDAGATSFASSGNIRLTVSDAAVQRGTFTVSVSGDGAGLRTSAGDLTDFVSFIGRDVVTPVSAFGVFTATLAFAPDGTISNGDISFGSRDDDLYLTGSSASISARFASDQYNAGCPNVSCAFTGQFFGTASATAVPEPMSIALLGAGLLGLAGARTLRSGR